MQRGLRAAYVGMIDSLVWISAVLRGGKVRVQTAHAPVVLKRLPGLIAEAGAEGEPARRHASHNTSTAKQRNHSLISQVVLPCRCREGHAHELAVRAALLHDVRKHPRDGAARRAGVGHRRLDPAGEVDPGARGGTGRALTDEGRPALHR